MLRRSRDIVRRTAGRFRVVGMAVTAASSFRTSTFPMIGPFSVIRVLSVITLFGLVSALRAIRSGDVARHGTVMRALCARALMPDGALAFLAGRRTGKAVFPGKGMAALAGLAVWLPGRDGRTNPLPFPMTLR